MPKRTLYERAEEFQDIFGRKRKRITLDSGREVTFLDAVTGVESAFTTVGRWMSRASKLATDDDQWEQERLDRLIERLYEMANAMKHARDMRLEWKRREERIKAMRNVSGRPPEEAEAFLARAKKEERVLQAEMRRYGF
jgi:hypothetical protein